MEHSSRNLRFGAFVCVSVFVCQVWIPNLLFFLLGAWRPDLFCCFFGGGLKPRVPFVAGAQRPKIRCVFLFRPESVPGKNSMRVLMLTACSCFGGGGGFGRIPGTAGLTGRRQDVNAQCWSSHRQDVPSGTGIVFPPQATSPSALGCSQPPSVRGQPPSAVVPVPFQLRPWWTPLYGTSFFLAFGDVLPPCPMGISSTMGGHGCQWAERDRGVDAGEP